MFDHVDCPVSDYQRARDFYDVLLAPLGLSCLIARPAKAADDPSHAGYGRDGHAGFWICDKTRRGRLHLAFAAATRAEVDAFHAAGLAAGGTDNGGPGLRSYAPNYYAAYVLDPDGNNIEAVCRASG